jgi:hypothetical protein
MRKTRFISPWFIVFLVLALAAACSGCSASDLTFNTEYQAVVLDNGQVFFGKLGDAGSPFLLLQDVFYVQRATETGKKEPVNVLLKRGSEWHGPEFMRLNAKHVMLIEPVAANSRLAQLIKEAKAAPAAAAPQEGAPPPAAAPPEKPAPPAAAPAPPAPPAAPVRR